MLNDSEEMSNNVETVVTDYGNQLYMCSASIRELAAAWSKYTDMQKDWRTPSEMVQELCDQWGVQILYPQREHYQTFLSLRWNLAANHRDTTDLLIIAHAITEGLTLISSDTKFDFYCNQGLDYLYNKR